MSQLLLCHFCAILFFLFVLCVCGYVIVGWGCGVVGGCGGGGCGWVCGGGGLGGGGGGYAVCGYMDVWMCMCGCGVWHKHKCVQRTPYQMGKLLVVMCHKRTNQLISTCQCTVVCREHACDRGDTATVCLPEAGVGSDSPSSIWT